MRKITAYKVFQNPDLQVLEEEINTWIANGWQPYGFLALVGFGVLSSFQQVMVQYKSVPVCHHDLVSGVNLNFEKIFKCVKCPYEREANADCEHLLNYECTSDGHVAIYCIKCNFRQTRGVSNG